jgi:hypothetical protein
MMMILIMRKRISSIMARIKLSLLRTIIILRLMETAAKKIIHRKAKERRVI